eukprot:TCONS_00043675-protein
MKSSVCLVVFASAIAFANTQELSANGFAGANVTSVTSTSSVTPTTTSPPASSTVLSDVTTGPVPYCFDSIPAEDCQTYKDVGACNDFLPSLLCRSTCGNCFEG